MVNSLFVLMRRALLFFLLSSLGLTSFARAEAPNIILITVDTTRADRMGFLGNKKGLTPNLDALARQGVVFEKAFSQAPLTPVSHATIFTGTYPQFHTVTDFGHPLPSLLPFVPEILQKSGYHTAAFIGSLILDPKANMAPGFDRGFDFFDAGFHPKRGRNEDRYDTIERRAGDVVGHAIALAEARTARRRFLSGCISTIRTRLTILLRRSTSALPIPTTARLPTPTPPWASFSTYLRQRGLYDRALIAMMSDHGESLGAHGESMHGIFLYDETIHVPLLFKLPGAVLAGRRVSTRVRLVDVAPTLLSMLSLPLPPTFQGESLVPVMKSAPKSSRQPSRSAGLRRDRLSAPGFWLERDPRACARANIFSSALPGANSTIRTRDQGAEHNLAATSPAVTDTLQAQLDQFRDRPAASTTKPSQPQ